MRRRLITCVSCQDGKELWCLDEQIYALCKINKESLQAECVVPPTEILEDADYEVRQIVVWREKLLILPVRLNQWWVIYDKNTGKLEHRNFCGESHRSAASVLIGDHLILLPVCVKDPVVILNLQKQETIVRCYLQDTHFVPDDGMAIWDASVNQETIFFLIRGSCYYGQIKDQKVCLVKIHAPEPLWCADFYENNGWAVGNCGKYLYQFDEKGNLLKSFLINLETEIVRILVKAKRVFLLPAQGNKIWIFDKSSEQVKNIDMEENIPIFPPLPGVPDYWDYVEMKQKIWFLPMKYPLLIINADTGESYQKTITYTDRFSREKYGSYCNDVREIRKRTFFFGENTEGGLEDYLELLRRDTIVSRGEKESYGEIIWKTFVEKNYG